jgi:hypothetical protein
VSPRRRRREPTKAPSGYVVQKGRYITVTGLAKPWKPTVAELAAFDPDMRVTPVPPGGLLHPEVKHGGLVLSFSTQAGARDAFGKLFSDCALGLADAMPDDSNWIDSKMRKTAKLMTAAAAAK